MALTHSNFFSGVNTSSHLVSESGGNSGSKLGRTKEIQTQMKIFKLFLKWSTFGACGSMTRAKMLPCLPPGPETKMIRQHPVYQLIYTDSMGSSYS